MVTRARIPGSGSDTQTRRARAWRRLGPAAASLLLGTAAPATAVAQGATPPSPLPPPSETPAALQPAAAPAPQTAAPATAPAPSASPVASAPPLAAPAASASPPSSATVPPAPIVAPPSAPAQPANRPIGLTSPEIHHAPVATATQHEPISIEAQIDHPELVRSLVVVYRTARGALGSAPFQRSAGAGYVAVIPRGAVDAPGIAYTIELERTDGVRTSAFATRAAMQPIQVLEDLGDARERALYMRLGGRRSVVTVSGEYVRFGKTAPKGPILCAAGQDRCTEGTMLQPADAAVNDQYYRIEVGYTYRPLTTVAEFSLRGGVIRGTSLVGGSTFDESKYKVGANYGAPTVRFRLADAWHLETEFLTSITEIGFSVGFGGALLIGDPYGTRLTLGFETIGPADRTTYFGSRFYTRMDIAASERLTIAPIIEVTDMPHAEDFGVRLLGEAALGLGSGFTLGLRGGYQARRSTSGGPALGGNLSLAF